MLKAINRHTVGKQNLPTTMTDHYYMSYMYPQFVKLLDELIVTFNL